MKTSTSLLFLSLTLSFAIGCGKSQKPFDGLQSTSYSGNIVVAALTTDPATGPGLVSMWGTDGTFKSTLRDLYSGSEWASGVGFISPDKIILAIEGVDRLEVLNLGNSSNSAITHVGLTGTPLRQLATSSASGSILVAEATANSIEKFTASGSRTGNPFIPTTSGSCVLSSPWGVAILPNEDIVVISSGAAGRFSKYDKDGTCLTHVTTAPFNAGTPTSIAYHATTGKLLVAFATTHAIWAVDTNGGSATQIYLNSTIINTPRAITTDSDGNIYVSSSGTDTIEKLSWNGTGTASRALSGPFLGPNIFSQNVTSMTVIP